MLKFLEHKEQKFVVINTLKCKLDEVQAQLLSAMEADPQIKIASVRITHKGKTLDNFRNFPALLDLIVKNFSFLRTRFSQRMRRYLLWDLDVKKRQEVDWLTSDLLFMPAEYYQSLNLDFSQAGADVKAAALTWEAGFKVIYFGNFKVEVQKRKQSKKFSDKLAMLLKAFKFKFQFRNFLNNGNYPSKLAKFKLQRVHKANKLENRSFVSKLGAPFQKKNTVIQVYEGVIQSDKQYKQPLVFWTPGVITLLENQKGEFGLIRIWRHAPLQKDVPNIFPVFPDMADLGSYYWELVRGGIEKTDVDLIAAAVRECKEEINLKETAIVSTHYLQNLIPNTAIDVSSMHLVHIKLDASKFDLRLQADEHIKTFQWFTKAELHDIISEGEIQCSLTLAGLSYVIYAK